MLQEGGGAADAAAAGAVPADVAASMRQFIQALTTPETEMEQQASKGQGSGQAQGAAQRLQPGVPPCLCAAASPASASRTTGGARFCRLGPCPHSSPSSLAPLSLLQILAEVTKWAARHDSPRLADSAAAAAGPTSTSYTAATAADATKGGRCLAGSSMNNLRSSSSGWSGGTSGSDAATGVGPAAAPAAGPSTSSGSSGRSSEEGSSAAWRLCTWLQRAGWSAEHCASIRSGGGGSGGGGWQFCSGHEFLLLHPHRCKGPAVRAGSNRARKAADLLAATSSGNSTSDGSSSDSEMGDAALAVVVDPEFSTQFALAAPTARYQVRLPACLPACVSRSGQPVVGPTVTAGLAGCRFQTA